jgi:Uma2 family endonuclease
MSTPTVAPNQPVTYGLDASMAKFSVERYQRMIEAGILDDEDKVELLEGYVVLKMPRNPRHDNAIDRIVDVLYPLRPTGWRIRVQCAIRLSDSQPEPDIAMVRGDLTRFETAHPTAADVGLLIESADTSLQRDIADKARIYARAGIPAYWVLNLVDRRVEVFTRPSGPTAAPVYADHQVFHPGDTVPLVLDGVTVAAIPVAELLP